MSEDRRHPTWEDLDEEERELAEAAISLHRNTVPAWENPIEDLREAAQKLRNREDPSDVTYEKIAEFNRALHPHVLEAAQRAGISPHNIVLHAVFLMPGGGMLPCYLSPPLTEE